MDDMSFHWPKPEPTKVTYVTMTVAEARALFNQIPEDEDLDVFAEVLDKAQGDVTGESPAGVESYLLVKITAT